MTALNKMDKSWTLFLDRDGVLNERFPGDYVKKPDDFTFIPGVIKSLSTFAGIFDPIVVVTNQQGIGRGIMTNAQLHLIHERMLEEVRISGGRIDAVFYSPDLKNTRSFTRKPAIGMGLKAKNQFPSINFKKSIMVGDTYSDILFGHRLGMFTVLVGSDKDVVFQCSGILDLSFPDLISFAEYVQENI